VKRDREREHCGEVWHGKLCRGEGTAAAELFLLDVYQTRQCLLLLVRICLSESTEGKAKEMGFCEQKFYDVRW
jgi:hypothetical protein